MSYQGKKIAEAILQHRQGPLLNEVAKALLTRPLGEKHFARVKDYMNNTLAAAQEKIQWHLRDSAESNPRVTLGQRQLELFLLYMAVNSQDYDEYTPAVQRILVSRTALLLFDRALPLKLHVEHLEFRHIQRSAKVLSYQEDPFKFAVAFSLLLVKALESKMPAEPAANLPIVIPQPEGLFLGSASAVDPRKFLHENCLYLTHDESKGQGQHITILPQWVPTVEITLRTYVHQRELTGGQRLLHQALTPFMTEPVKIAALTRLVDCYVIGQLDGVLRGVEKQNFEAALQELTQVVQGPEWRRETQRATAHFAKKELH